MLCNCIASHCDVISLSCLCAFVTLNKRLLTYLLTYNIYWMIRNYLSISCKYLNKSGCFDVRKHGAELVFIGTRAGLTRLLSLTDIIAQK